MFRIQKGNLQFNAPHDLKEMPNGILVFVGTFNVDTLFSFKPSAYKTGLAKLFLRWWLLISDDTHTGRKAEVGDGP